MALEFHWAWGQSDRLRALAADLVRRQVALIATSGTVSSLAAKAATTAIPIVFSTAADPIAMGLVASLNRPGGNATGVANLNVELGPKQLELLHELLPTATPGGIPARTRTMGWSEGRNIRIDIRFALAPSADQAHRLAKELVALRTEVILAQSTAVTVALQQETNAIPIRAV